MQQGECDRTNNQRALGGAAVQVFWHSGSRRGLDINPDLGDCLSRMTEALSGDGSASAVAGPDRRGAAEAALLDAAERLLLDVGGAGVTTRRVAEEAGVNHGLVHYYFGSIENLLARVLERFTDVLIARQRELYAEGGSFVLDAFALDRSAVAFDNCFGDRQPDP